VIHLSAPVNIEQVPVMCRGTRSNRTRIAGIRVNSRNYLDIGGGHGHIVAASNPMLRARMAESRCHRRELGHCIIRVCDTPLGIDVRDIFC
jgi:hypothetical protein